jgi:DNA mismatch repair protein MutL
VNIHPAKREVKFHREFEVRKFVAQAIRETLLAFHGEPEKPKTDFDAGTQRRGEEIKSAPETFALRNFPGKLKASPVTPAQVSPVIQTPLSMGFSSPSNRTKPEISEAELKTQNSKLKTAAPFAALTLDSRPSTSATPLLNVPLRLVGVVGKLYVLLESDRGLVLLDQHAAHERILFEQMLNRLEQNHFAPSQKLLLPETIELPPRDAQFLREQLAVLTRLGVGLSEFGERTFLLDALPPFVKAADPRRFVFDLVDELKAAGREVNLARLGEHTVAKTVCRHAVKANDFLAGAELENLVEDLRRCAMPYTCPHGRPTLIEMNYRELEKKFGRTQ